MRLSLAFLGNKSSEFYPKIKEILARNDMIHVVKILFRVLGKK